jgi:hypothetical protein
VLIPTLHGFGVDKGVATVAVLAYRLINFWLPIPVGGGCYLSLRLESVHGFRQRVIEVRKAATEDHPAAASLNTANSTRSGNGNDAEDRQRDGAR